MQSSPLSGPSSRANGRHRRRSRARAWWLVAIVIVAGAGLFLTRLGMGVRGLLFRPGAPEMSDSDLAALSAASCHGGRSLVVAPDGAPAGEGSMNDPLDLATALTSASPARPCDTIWLQGGTYTGPFVSSLRGETTRPIVVRSMPGEQATLDGAATTEAVLTVNGTHTWFWGLHVTSSDPVRVSAEAGPWPSDLRRGGIAVQGTYLKFINMVVHDLTRGFGIGSASLDTEVYGSLIFHNGWKGSDGNTNGHGIETHNRTGSRRISDNVIFNQFDHGVIAYSSEENRADFIVLEGNILFNNGVLGRQGPERDVLIGGAAVAESPVLRENMTYGGAQTVVGHGNGCRAARLEGNDLLARAPFVIGPCDAVVTGNTFHESGGALSAAYPQNTFLDRPSGLMVRIRPNRFEPGRAHVVVYNWDRTDEVDVDLSTAGIPPESRYEIRDAQNFFGPPVAQGRFSAAARTVVLPMTGLAVTRPVGEGFAPPPHSAPDFAVFVVLPADAGAGPPTRG